MKKYIICLLLFLSVTVVAQKQINVSDTNVEFIEKTKIDTTYYKKIPQKDMFISASVNRNILHLRTTQPKDRSYFLPNQILQVSVGVSHPKIPFDITVGTEIGGYRKEYPKTKSLDIMINKYARSFVIDVFYRKFKGFYIDNYVDDLINEKLTLQERSYPDLRVLLVGAFGQYVFNGREFSYQSAFNPNKEKQLQSAGSFLTGGSVYYFDMASGKNIIGDIKKLEQYQFGLNGGYAYNWVINPKWMMHGSASGGVNLTSKFKVKPTYLIRASCFYQGDKWATGLTAVANIITLINKENVTSRFDSGFVSLTVVRRFELKKKGKSLPKK